MKKKPVRNCKQRRNDARNAKCRDCGKRGADVTYGIDPFASEVYNDNTKFWMCPHCRHESAMDI